MAVLPLAALFHGCPASHPDLHFFKAEPVLSLYLVSPRAWEGAEHTAGTQKAPTKSSVDPQEGLEVKMASSS